jgi:intracellular sulfur oxidation DsrE/DsrF family protein
MSGPRNEAEGAATPRRKWLAQLGAIVAGFGLTSSPLQADADVEQDSLLDGDAWMKPLRGKHRQFFHAMALAEEPLRMAHNFLDAYRDAFKTKPAHVNAVIGVQGGALFLGLDDSVWKKYELGKMTGFNDPKTGAHAVRNVYAKGGPYTVDALQKRGVAFIMCNTALRNRTQLMADSLRISYDALYAELVAARLPGVSLVPAMVVAVNRAQERGFTYIRAS